ncbi:immunoglobulin domain-containing protein, partial [Capnocytophaga leadbetteri]
MYKHLQSLLVLFILSFSFGKLNAQTCDENIRKALEQTRITTFAQVTQGATGKFVIRYPLAGTKYTLRDQAGNTYDYTYTGNPVQIAITIPVGAVTTARSFSFTAENGSCSYSSGFDYTITPQTTTGLSVRVENEWCERGGGIFFQLIGTAVNESDYTFHYKKSSETNYDYTKQLSPSTGIEAIVAGSYDLIAKHKTETSKNIEKKNILIQSTVETVEYNLIYAPAICSATKGDIRVNVTKGKYPLFFSLLKEDGSAYSTATTRQTSNIFKNIPVGEYKVRVEDFCAIGGGNAPQPQAISAKNFTFNLKRVYSADAWEYSCNYVNFDKIWFEGDHLPELLEADSFPYPFSIQILFESPTHRTYTKTITISDRRDFESKLQYGYQNGELKFLILKNPIREGYSVEYGTWKVRATLTSACGTTNVAEKQTIVTNPFDEINVMTEVKGSSCKSIAIVRNTIGSRSSSPDTNIPVYFVLENYPNSFNPEAAGFYKINTTHPSLINKYVKRFDYNGPNLVDPEFLNTGDKFTFKAVYDSCNREKTFSEITIPTNAPTPSVISIYPVGACKGVSATGTDYVTMVIDQRSGSPITKVVIKNTTADTSKLPAGMTLPYTLKDSEHITNNYWMVNDLPKGNYTIEHTNACGAVHTQQFELIGDVYDISWQEGCTPKLKFKLTSTQSKNLTSFFIQRYDKATQKWERVEQFTPSIGINHEYTITGNTKGKFRLVRFVSASSHYMNTGILYDCQQVISEKEYIGSMLEPKVFGLGCPSANVHHVLVVPQGGVPPYTYKLVSKEIAGHSPQVLNKIGDDDNFFLKVDASNTTARYVFQVTDACGEAKTVDYRVSNFVAPSLTAEQEFYCSGQSARLSIPKMGNNMKIDWYRSDKTVPVATNTNTLYIASLTEADFNNTYSVKLTGNYAPDVNACVTAATIQAYQFKRRVVNTPSFTMPSNTPVIKCINSSYNEKFDLSTMFNKPAALTTYLADNPTVKVKITDEAGVLSIPDDGKVDLKSRDFIANTHTIVYTLENACGQKLLEAKNSLTVNSQIDISTDSNVNLCSPNPTYNEVTQYIKERNHTVRALLATFDWYTSLADAKAKINKQTGTASIGNISETTPKTLYLRYSKIGFCDSDVMTITVKKVATTAPAVKSLGTVCAVTVEALKKLIDPTDFANVVIYHNNNVLVNDYSLTNDSQIYYAKKVGTCQTAKAKVNFTLQAVTQAAPQSLSLCATTNQYGNLIVSNERVKKALKAIYPTIPTNEIKLYKKQESQESFNEYTETLILVNQVLYFTIKEVNKCTSPYYRLLLSTTLSQTTASPVVASLCSDATVADLRATIGGAHTINIYKENAVQTDALPIDWDKINNYTYTILEAGGCESLKASITLTKSNNTTSIIPKGVNLCGGVAQTIATIKAQLGDSSAKVYLKNGNNYDEQADNATVNTTLTYYYTVKAAGKCISEKAPIAITISQSTPTPQGPNSTTGCIKTVGDLRSYIRTNDPSRSTDDLAIYAGLLDTNKGTALADSTTLTQTTYSYAYTKAGKCESAIRHITISRVATPTVAQTAYTLCGGGSQTIASLQPQGTNIVWYNSATGGSPLASTTPLVAGTTYYVAQKSGTCESERVAVAVTQGASGNETLAFSTPFSKTLKCVPSGQLRFQVQNAVAGQSYVVELTQVPTGYTGSRTFTITKDNKEGNVPFVWLTQNNIPKGTYKARLIKCGVSQEIGQTITELTSNFPIRDNFDAGPYLDINDCNYANLRNSQARAGGIDINAYFQNEAIAKQFFEYTAVSPQDMFDKGWTSASQIPDSYWREVYSLPAGVTSSQPKVIYYDLAAFGRNYADLAIANKKPKFYFRIKGQPSCGVSAPIEFGDTRMLAMKMAYGGSCTAPTIKISLDRTVIVCKPITYEVKNESGQVVASGTTNVANAIIDITTLNGNPINPNEKYSVTVKAAAPDTQSATTIARSFNQAKAAYRPDGQYAEIKRCFGHPERTEMYIQGFLRDNGVLLSLKGYKVTLESAPAGYADEPNKLKVGESYTITRDDTSYNLLSTLNVQNAAGFSSLPEGDYKIKIEDPCGQTYYVENGRRKKANILTIEHPQYSEKPLTPEKEVACTGVKVYPFKGNTAQDWLKKNNQNQNLYVWLVKIPTGVNAADISTTPQQPGTYAGNTYQRAIYSSDNATTLDTYFTLPRNENSTGLYTFAYAEDEREIYNYIANLPTACVRTFTISVDDVLLNIDRSTYVGYKCEGSTGKIVVKAVNGINDANNYTYELYATKTGTVIETKTAAKGTTVTFTNLGTFSTGQNTRWLKLTDASCPTQSMWRELPIDILEKPATGKTYTFCAAATVAELKAKIATDTATVNVYKNGTLVANNNEALTTTDVYTVSRFNATCETDKVSVAVVFSNTVTLTVPTALTVTCTAANIDATVNNWLGQATVTDTCGVASLTHNFTAVKPINWCGASVVTVTFVGKDPQGNTVTKTSVIKVNSVPIVAKDDTYTVTNGLTGGTTPSVLTNDSL